MKYFELKGNQFLATVPCELIINENNIETNADGNLDVFMFGTLLITHENNSVKSHTMTLATRVTIPIYSGDQVKKLEDGEHYLVSFEAGDVVVDNNIVPANIENVYELFNNLLMGKLSNTIPYHEYYQILENAMQTNVRINVPKVFLEVMIGELFHENGKPARLSNDVNVIGKAISINDSVQSQNTFNSLTFEDYTKSMLINLAKSDEEQISNPSPLEKFSRM